MEYSMKYPKQLHKINSFTVLSREKLNQPFEKLHNHHHARQGQKEIRILFLFNKHKLLCLAGYI